MSYELCRQIKTNGRRCQSPALTGENWCFFHHRLHFRRRALHAPSPSKPPRDRRLLIPPIEDCDAVQVALSLVIEGTASGEIDEKLARVLLRGLQIASRNAISLEAPVPPAACVRDYLPTLDGMELAGRAMSDGSEPPAREARVLPPPLPRSFKTAAAAKVMPENEPATEQPVSSEPPKASAC